MDPIMIIGTLGALIILIAFLLNQLHRLDSDNIWFDLLNFVGSTLLVLYAWLLASYPFLFLNTVWMVVSARDVYIDYKAQSGKRKHHKTPKDESEEEPQEDQEDNENEDQKSESTDEEPAEMRPEDLEKN